MHTTMTELWLAYCSDTSKIIQLCSNWAINSEINSAIYHSKFLSMCSRKNQRQAERNIFIDLALKSFQAKYPKSAFIVESQPKVVFKEVLKNHSNFRFVSAGFIPPTYKLDWHQISPTNLRGMDLFLWLEAYPEIVYKVKWANLKKQRRSVKTIA